MRANIREIKRLLKTGDIARIFRHELGWNNPPNEYENIPFRGQLYTFTSIADKLGFRIYLYTFEGRIPDRQFLIALDREVVFRAAAHLTIFMDAKRENQVWLWVKDKQEGGKQRSIPRLHRYNNSQNGESLAQKIDLLYISLFDEDKLTLTSVLDRVTQGFDVDKVERKFYDLFQKQHTNFMRHIDKITDQDDLKWYTSIMLNRLMFVYFLQRKKVLNNKSSVAFDGSQSYLEDRLKEVRDLKGADKFYTFYRYFLLRLFHDGLSKPEPHSPELEQIIGKVPYINGGIFDVHPLEQKYPEIRIKDEAFEELFAFFRKFEWHLDNRSMRNDNEVNPDVLGYIFEKYINQKEKGAYYTKEDITDCISKNALIPFLFEKVAQNHPDAFAPNGPIWSLLRQHPGEYIYEEMAYGLLEPLPPEIAAGINDVSHRTLWNQPAPEEYALPTETWREVVERQRRYREVYEKIERGEVCAINDLITYNLNITQFARDVIASCEQPDLLRSFYTAIEHVTVLDPTCGSGAFLFAALNILKPLYQTCITRMRELLTGKKVRSNAGDDFERILGQIEKHRSQDYFILKTITVNNLYGVDIMEEAIEICKLRLFLKLVAQIESPQQLEPLPDIDFNVVAGNTLIGFTSLEQIRRLVTEKLNILGDTREVLVRIEELAKEIDRDEQSFRNLQNRQKLDLEPEIMSAHKQSLRKKLEKMRKELDPYLATEYGIYEDKYTSVGGGLRTGVCRMEK